jgi:hypothetical protein
MDLTALEVDSFEQAVSTIPADVLATRSIEVCAQRLTGVLYDLCRAGGTDRALVLSRVYLSLPYGELPPETQAFVQERFTPDPDARARFLALMGTTGLEPAWCERLQSRGHQAIPLNRETVKSVPMLARCFQQIGFDLDIVLKGEHGIVMDGIPTSFGVFHVQDALGSPYVPAQDEFVKPYGARTVIGGGTMLPDGAVSVWIGFTRVTISSDAILPLVRLMPAFWHKCYPRYREGLLFG